MSMPNFPAGVSDITCEQALNMLMGSIAMEELALSHILNAEGEKLQYILGTLPGSSCRCTTPKEILEVNRSISDLMERVAYNQLLLKGKLQQVLDARAICHPPEPHCPPECPCNCSCVWTTQGCKKWLCDRPFIWEDHSKDNQDICWQGCAPSLIYLCPQKTYLICCSFQLCAGKGDSVGIALQKVNSRTGEDIFVCSGITERSGTPLTISGSTVLSTDASASGCPIQFALKSPNSVTVQRATLNLIVLS